MSEAPATRRPVAVVTGASSGIGAATARRLAAEGYAVVVAARRRERLDALAAEIRERGGEALVVDGDIARLEDCQALIRQAAAWGRVEVLVANAGFGHVGPFDEMKDEEIRRLIDVNVLGVLRTVKETIPLFKQNGGGKIVIIGSVLSRIATSYNAVYTATKHAVIGLADALRLELHGTGIRVIAILPGYTATEFFDVALHRVKRAADAVRNTFIMASPDDVAAVIARRIRSPRAETVIGALNLGIVLLARWCPPAYRAVHLAMERFLRRSEEPAGE